MILDSESAAPFLIKGEFHIRTLEEARSLATFLATACPEPRIAIVGLSEIFINAIEHGNLGIGGEEKTELQNKMLWLEEINKRLALEENKNKFVKVEFLRSEKELAIKVTDQGAGFDWKKYKNLEEKDRLSTHGRGLAMAKDLAFSRQEYSGKGNIVTCYIALSL